MWISEEEVDWNCALKTEAVVFIEERENDKSHPTTKNENKFEHTFVQSKKSYKVERYTQIPYSFDEDKTAFSITPHPTILTKSCTQPNLTSSPRPLPLPLSLSRTI